MSNKISVIIPCYNQGHFLNESLDSVLAQTHLDWECIIVDDGSTDNTLEVANIYIDLDNRFRYFRKDNGGLSSARNAGIEKITGQWVQFLDADDVIEPEKFSNQLESVSGIKEENRIVIYCDYAFGGNANIYEMGKRIIPVRFNTKNYFKELIERWEVDLIIPCHCFLFASDIFLQDGIRFDESLPNHEDFDCWLSIFSMNPSVIFKEEILCRYRQSAHSMSANMKLMGEGFLQVLNKRLKEKTYSTEIHSLFISKRLDVLQRYKRFNLMTIKEKFASRKVLKEYYYKRILEKLK